MHVMGKNFLQYSKYVLSPFKKLNKAMKEITDKNVDSWKFHRPKKNTAQFKKQINWKDIYKYFIYRVNVFDKEDLL